MNALTTKDFIHYRQVQSPIAPIAERFFTFLGSSLSTAKECRYAYARCYLGKQPPSIQDYMSSSYASLDDEIKDYFLRPPQLALAQGPMKPYGLLAKPSSPSSTSPSSPTSLTEPIYVSRTSIGSSTSQSQVDPFDTIFLPWQLHQHLKDAIAGGKEEVENKRFSAYFALACLVHETAHWITVSRHGYIAHKDRPEENISSLVFDRKMGQVVSNKRDDWGMSSKELLMGHAFMYLTYADGTSEVVTQKILPMNPKLKPSLPREVQMKIIDEELPQMIDITRYGCPNVREPPRWRENGYLIVTCVTPFSCCHHGDCTSIRS